MHHFNNKKHVARAILFGIVFIVLLSVIVFLLWNWLMPVIFGLHTINIFQAFGILVLSKILFLGFHRRPGPYNHFKAREYWKKRFEEERKSEDGNLGKENI